MSIYFKKWLHKCLAAAIIFFATLICLFVMGNVRPDDRPSAKELVNLYKKAVTCWDKSVAMRVETEHSMAKRGVDETDIRHWRYDITHRRDGNRCEWFGRCQFKGEHDGEEYSFNTQFKSIVGDDFVLRYAKQDDEEEPDAFMGTDVEEKLFTLQTQEPDGGFLQGRMSGIGSAPKMVEVMSSSGSLKLSGQETLNGSLCHIVEANTKYGTFTVWIAPEKGYNALKYVVHRSGHDILRDDIHFEDQGITECVEVVDSIDVRKIDGVFIPVSGKLTDKVKAGNDWERTDHVEAKRSEIVLNPDFKALGAFKISFPEGTEVTHKDIPGRRFRWTNGKFVPDMDKYLIKDLTGKPLPGFDKITTGFDPDSAKEKMILVCFWDMNQRSSRRCLIKLAEMAEKLAEKNIIVLGVHSSKVAEGILNDWLEKYEIPFPVGIIQDNVRETLVAWGVRGQPWLILADKEHVVRAEGFALEELGEKIKSAGDGKQ